MSLFRPTHCLSYVNSESLLHGRMVLTDVNTFMLDQQIIVSLRSIVSCYHVCLRTGQSLIGWGGKKRGGGVERRWLSRLTLRPLQYDLVFRSNHLLEGQGNFKVYGLKVSLKKRSTQEINLSGCHYFFFKSFYLKFVFVHRSMNLIYFRYKQKVCRSTLGKEVLKNL